MNCHILIELVSLAHFACTPIRDKILLSSKAAYNASGQEVQAGLFITKEDRTPATSRLEVWSLIFMKAIYGPKISYHYVSLSLFKHV